MAWTTLKPFVTAIDHVGIAVPDLDEAIAFYRDILGLELTHDETNESQGVREAMMRAPGDDRPARPCNCSRRSARTPRSGSSSTARDPGVQQVAYRVTDIDAATEALRAKGLRVLYDEAGPRHREQPRELRAPQGRRRRAHRAGGTGA